MLDLIAKTKFFTPKKKKREITVLTLGDRADYDEYKKFNREKHTFIKRGFDYKTVNYEKALKGEFPKINTKRIIIFLFFPFNYWNKNIEYKNYQGLYGNRVFYKKFVRFWRRINNIIKKHFSDKEILIVNNPLLCARYRDKQLVESRLSKAGIPNSKPYHTTRIKDIYRLLARGTCLFLKSRYGSMGKGITYLSPLNWQTNFNFKNNRIISRRSDHGWKFRDVTGNSSFLSKLIKHDILIEKAIDCLILERRRIDLRIYTLFKKPLYIYPKTNHPEKITTNISQGGKGSPHILKFIPRRLISRSKKIAVKAAEALNLDLAGVDILIDRNRKDIYIVDVNVFPGFPKRRTFNLSRSIIKELARLDNKGQFFR